MAKSFEYLRNEYCHKILEALYKNASPVARELTYSQLVNGEEGKILTNEYFPAMAIDVIRDKIKKDQGFTQDCCELLAFNEHISKEDRTDKGIFLRVRFTKAGVLAFKTEYYLKENKKITDDKWIRNSTVFNNFTTPFIALAALIVAINQCNSENCDKALNTTQTGQQQKVKGASENQTEVPAQYPDSSNIGKTPKTNEKD